MPDMAINETGVCHPCPNQRFRRPKASSEAPAVLPRLEPLGISVRAVSDYVTRFDFCQLNQLLVPIFCLVFPVFTASEQPKPDQTKCPDNAKNVCRLA